jgi:hypothetical protein
VWAEEAVLQPEQQVHFEVEADTLVLLGKAAFGNLRLASMAVQMGPTPVAMPPRAMTKVRKVYIA